MMTKLFKSTPGGVRVVELEALDGGVLVREGLFGGELVESFVERRSLDACVAERVADAWTLGTSLEPTAARFYREGFVPQLVANFGVKLTTPSTRLVEETQAIYGVAMPEELRALLELRGGAELGWCDYGEWRIWPDDLIPIDLEADNCFVELLASYSSHCLRVLMADLVPLGTAGDGDVYYAHLDRLQPEHPPVYLFDHEEVKLEIFADSIPSLAELNRLYVVHAGDVQGEESDPLETVRVGMKRLAARISPSWHYESLVEASGVEPAYELRGEAKFAFWRSAWIAKLLEADLTEAKGWFEPLIPVHATKMNWEESKTAPSFLLPSRALYWLFTLFFFDKPELGEAVALAKESPSRFVRDAARTFEELASGARTHIGELDVIELRRRWLALDLDPSRAKEREAAEIAKKAAKKAEREREREDARAFGERASSPDEIAAELWRSIDQRVRTRELGRLLVASDPALALDGHRLELVLSLGEGWNAALDALALSEAPRTRALLAVCLAHAVPRLLGDVVAALTPEERALVVESAPARVALWRTWRRAVRDKAGAIRALALLGLLDPEELAALAPQLLWSERQRDVSEGESEESEETPTAFGALGTGWPDPEYESEDESDEDESDEDEDESDEDESDEDESDEDESDEDESDEDEDEDEDESDEDESDEDEDESDEDEDEDESGEDEDESDEDEDESDEDESDEDESDEDDEEPTIELDPEEPLAREHELIRRMRNKKPLLVVLRLLGEAKQGEEALRAVLESGPRAAFAAAIIALAQVPTDSARESVERHLHGGDASLALYALARRGDPKALPAVEAALRGKDLGLPHLTVYDRLMRESLRGAAGGVVDLDVPRLAQQTQMRNQFAASELHVVALELLAKHAPRDEALEAARAFLDDEHEAVRETAHALCAALGAPVARRVLDPITLEALFAEEGVEGLRAALVDPGSIRKSELIRFAKERGVLGELEAEAIAQIEHMARFPFYTHNYKIDALEGLARSIEALFTLESEAATEALHRLRCSTNPAIRSAFEHERGVEARLAARHPIAPEDVLDRIAGHALPAATEVDLGAPRWVLGAQVHGIAFVRDRVVVGGAGRVVAFDRAGRLLPISEKLVDGWCYDVDYHAGVDRLAVGYSHGHCIVYDGTSFEKLTDLPHGLAGVRKVKFSPDGSTLATANDDRTLRLFSVAALEPERTWQEPYDVNSVAWLDDARLAFVTDQHLGVLARGEDEPRRVATGGGAEVQILDGKILAASQQFGLSLFDPGSLERLSSMAVKAVARARRSADGEWIFAAAYGGEGQGLTRWKAGRRGGKSVTDEELYAMEVDPESGAVLIGGVSRRVTVLDPEGTPTEEPRPLRDDENGGWIVAPPGSDQIAWIERSSEDPSRIEVLDAGGVLREHDLTGERWRELFRPATPLPGAAQSFVRVGDGAIVPCGDALVRLGPSPWSRETRRSERTVAFGASVVATSGKHLGWLDAESGELLHEADAGVTSSWIEYLARLDDDRFFVMGYDDPRAQLWSHRARRRVAEVRLDHRDDEGRFSRPYGVYVHRPSQRILISYWDYQIDVFRMSETPFELEHRVQLHQPMEYVLLSDDGGELIVGHASGLTGLSFPTAEPRWRYRTQRKITAIEALAGGRVAIGCADGALLVLGDER